MVNAETKEILGAAILGINGDEVVLHTLLALIYDRLPPTLVQVAAAVASTQLPATLSNICS